MGKARAFSRDESVKSIIAYEGYTTAAGNVGGTTLIDAALIGMNDFVTGKDILLMDGPSAEEDKASIAFNTVTGEITFAAAMSAQVGIGVTFRILNISSVEKNLIDLAAAVAAVAASVTSITLQTDTLPKLADDWLDGIDPTLWTLTDPATGAAWALADNNGVRSTTSIPNATEFARLVSIRRWISAIGAGTNHIDKKLVVEWEMTGANFANVDDTKFLAGLSTGPADDKSVANVIGFCINAGGVLTAYSSNGGNTQETVLAVGAPNTFQKFRLELYGSKVDYYVNEVLVASHDGSAAPFAVPSGLFYRQVYFPTTAGGAATFILGGQRLWYEET